MEVWSTGDSTARAARDPERPELLGNVSLRLTGNIYVAYRREPTL
jgi:hypothetical protein